MHSQILVDLRYPLQLRFLYPSGFPTGTLQDYARKHIITKEKLSFELKYLDFEASDIR